MMWKVITLLFAVVCTVELMGMMTGAPIDVSLDEFKNDSWGQKALDFAVVRHNQRSNAMFHHAVSKVVSVKKQVVAGVLYNITVDLVNTSCRKSNTKPACLSQAVHGQPTVEQCTFLLWVKVWVEDPIVLQSETCNRP